MKYADIVIVKRWIPILKFAAKPMSPLILSSVYLIL
jgi:hypothetical protein